MLPKSAYEGRHRRCFVICAFWHIAFSSRRYARTYIGTARISFIYVVYALKIPVPPRLPEVQLAGVAGEEVIAHVLEERLHVVALQCTALRCNQSKRNLIRFRQIWHCFSAFDDSWLMHSRDPFSIDRIDKAE